MKVKELIELLQEYDPDKSIMIRDNYTGYVLNMDECELRDDIHDEDFHDNCVVLTY